MSPRSRHLRGHDHSWQRRVWSRIAIDRLRRSSRARGAASSMVIPQGEPMSDETDRGPAGPLERPDRVRRPRLRRLASLALVLGVVIEIVRPNPELLSSHPAQDCHAAVTAEATDALQICKLEYQRTQDPFTGVRVASTMNNDGDRDGARRMANRFLSTPAKSDAFYLLGVISRSEDKDDEALMELQQARELHQTEHKPNELAHDDAELAMARLQRQEFADALRLLDECITQARLAEYPRLERACRMRAATTLIEIGYMEAADREMKNIGSVADAEQRSTTPTAPDTERSDLEYLYGNYFQETGQHASAITKFENAITLNGTMADASWASTTQMNLAYSYAETNQPEEARRHLEMATLFDSDRTQESQRTSVAARIAYRTHDLPRAAALIESYFHLIGNGDTDRDTQIDSSILGAQIELERGDLARAQMWARRGVAQVEAMRNMQAVLELRPWILAKWRDTYELLFTALARGHQVEAALMLFDQWQGRTVQDALARSHPPASLDYRGIADQITRLGGWMRATSQAQFARPADQASVLRTMRDIDLVALIVADHDVWRLTANHGAPTLSRLGSLEEIETLITGFLGDTTDAVLAAKLGALLLPESAFRATREVLHVILDGKLRGLPVAALRQGGALLIERRPMTYLLRLPETRCVPAAPPGHATVLGVLDPSIPFALVEAKQVSELLHTTGELGGNATRSALFAAQSDAVLHVAAHGKIGPDGPAIVLADGDVSALEISARRIAPSLVVLAACSAAVSDDPELAGSLASGFIGAGSQHVIATLRDVSDRGALALTTQFYQANGAADPIRALMTAQAHLANTASEKSWPYFVVFGLDVCRTAP